MQKMWRELLRSGPLVGVAGLILIPDGSYQVALFAIGLTLLVVAMSHVVRKLLYPYLDMQKLTDEAVDGNIAAAIVFASLVGLLMCMIASTLLVMK